MDLNQLLPYFPTALQRLRLRTGHVTPYSALRTIYDKTGVRISLSRLENWEMGVGEPRMASLLAILNGLGLTLVDLQDELEQVASEAEPPATEGADPEGSQPAVDPVDEDDGSPN